MRAVFLYGSLLEPQLRDVVFADALGNTLIKGATANDFATLKYPGEAFPVLMPWPFQKATGVVLIDPPAVALERMAFYEGDEYEIATLAVTLSNGDQIQAEYNKALELDGLVFNDFWCLDTWRKNESHIMIEMAKRYMDRCWGQMNIIEADHVWQELQSMRAR
jgi:hypothetical protein